jgi:NAD(P)H-hydrate epimerase|tara:strand:+ start:654 stop:1316 length:663 start_codon:yes stop_codon:yes gene_type:complete
MPNLSTTTYTATEVAELDRYTVEDLGIDLKQLMEIAGMRSAEIAVEMLPKDEIGIVAVLAGPGGNGGDALVCAKWLKLWGHEPYILLSHEREKLKPVTTHQLAIWEHFGSAVVEELHTEVDLIVDGLLGYSLSGDPRGHAAELIDWANDTNKPILALDIPSGMDATTGEIRQPCIKAKKTAVYGVLKEGLMIDGASEYTGDIHLIDIGFPREFPPEILKK